LLQDDIEWTPAARQEFLATIDEETDRLNKVIGNLLDMSRLQTGALEVSAAPVGLEEVLPAALRSLGLGDDRVRVDVSESLPRVLADPGLLERALANVIQNAIRFSPPTAPARITAGAVDGLVDVRVVDRGPGIPPEERERLFMPFQRLGDSAQAEGVGLGLAVAKGFVEAMGGEIEIEDTPGGGLTMVVRLRAAEQ
jgi:two-component system sensor histidine kinase KdpD